MLPSPATFAEGQRAVYGWLIAAAGVFNGIGFSCLLFLLWKGGWSAGTESQRIAALAVLGGAFPLGQLAVIVALAVGGPVGKLRVTKDEIAAEAKTDHIL